MRPPSPPRAPPRTPPLACAAAIALTLVLAAFAAAGPLNPPPGPVASTHKTLTEIEPRLAINDENTPGDADSVYRIDEPGSYYLTGNVLVNRGAETGIEIAASNVTIDLMGFTLMGDADPDLGEPGVSLDGIRTVEDVTSITIRNGVVARFGASGVDLIHSASSAFTLVEGVHVRENGEHGIRTTAGVIRHCIASGNLGEGIDAGNAGVVESCNASVNGAAGIRCATAGVIRGCATIGGEDGIVTGPDSIVADCTATGGGIVVGDASSVTGCTARGNPGDGITAGENCTMTGCTVRQSAGAGIVAGDGCSVVDCTVALCFEDGIRVSSNCTVRGNNSHGNGTLLSGAGVRAINSGNRVEANNCTGNDYGVFVLSGGNLITRNTASGNTQANWNISAGNACLAIQAVTTTGFTADSGGVSPGSADPNANFSY